MKRIILLAVPLLLTACGTPSEYERECYYGYDSFDDVFSCTKEKLATDPRNVSVVPHTLSRPDMVAHNLIIYGEYLDSQVRQGLMTDDQAIEKFEDKIHQ